MYPVICPICILECNILILFDVVVNGESESIAFIGVRIRDMSNTSISVPVGFTQASFMVYIIVEHQVEVINLLAVFPSAMEGLDIEEYGDVVILVFELEAVFSQCVEAQVVDVIDNLFDAGLKVVG